MLDRESGKFQRIMYRRLLSLASSRIIMKRRQWWCVRNIISTHPTAIHHSMPGAHHQECHVINHKPPTFHKSLPPPPPPVVFRIRTFLKDAALVLMRSNGLNCILLVCILLYIILRFYNAGIEWWQLICSYFWHSVDWFTCHECFASKI